MLIICDTYIRFDALVKGLVLVLNHEGLQFGALIRQHGFLADEASVVCFQDLVYFLQLFYLQHSDFVAMSVFTLILDIICHKFDGLFTKGEIALEHSLLCQVSRLKVAQNHFELRN